MSLPVFEIYTHKESGARIETHPWVHRDGRQMIGFTRIYPPRTGKGPAHVHSDNEQRNVVRFGIARYRIGKESGELGPGEELVIPPGAPHVDPFNDTDEALQMTTFFSPGSAWMTMFGRTHAQAIRDGNVDPQQQLKPLHLMLMLNQPGGTTFAAGLPIGVQRRLVIPLLAAVGRWKGYRPAYGFQPQDHDRSPRRTFERDD